MDEPKDVYERHGSLVWATVYRILGNHVEALDCCQDIFSEVLRGSQTRQVRDWPAFLKWLATRRAIDRLRRRRVDAARFSQDGDISGVAAVALSVDAGVISDELVARLKLELARLPEQQAEAFWLLSVEELSYEEISKQLGVEMNHVGVLVYRARQRLRVWLADLKAAGPGARSNSKFGGRD